ncbi:hypothetical protein ASD62_00175 [Phycicoccus sp. Root563]|nr:hypothetical protein ASD62_00175 [Phycicoccus sp. Root563]
MQAMLTVAVTDASDLSDEVVTQGAAIWARARNHRDGAAAPSAADCEGAIAGVRRRLALLGARILLAHRDEAVVGFALFAPNARATEVFYLAVDPEAWGGGIGTALLAAVDDLARQDDRPLELWVIDDNARAIAVYERAGWLPTDEVVRDGASGRLERRFVRPRW